MKIEKMYAKHVYVILFMLSVIVPNLSKAEAWEVTTNQNDPNPRYYMAETQAYYRRVPDKEIYYAPDAYVSTNGKEYYYRFGNTVTTQKAFPEPNVQAMQHQNNEYQRRNDVTYTTSLIYIPKGYEAEYRRYNYEEYNSPNYENYQPQPIKSGEKSKDYPIYFDN